MLGGTKWWMAIKWISKQGNPMERPKGHVSKWWGAKAPKEWNVNKETMSKDINERGQLLIDDHRDRIGWIWPKVT